jgi:hypothetical protein
MYRHVFHNIDPLPVPRQRLPGMPPQATLQERRRHAAGAGAAALFPLLPCLVLLLTVTSTDPVTTSELTGGTVLGLPDLANATSGMRTAVAMWGVGLLLSAGLSGALLAGVIGGSRKVAAALLMLTAVPAAVIGGSVGLLFTHLWGIPRDEAVAFAVLVAWVTSGVLLLVRAAGGYPARASVVVAATGVVVLVAGSPLARAPYLVLPLVMVAWACVAASSQWYPRTATRQTQSQRLVPIPGHDLA